MRILVLTNLYPPHHAGTYDFRCQSLAEALQKRGHEVRVLTSNHGMTTEQRDDDIERRLRLNGVFNHPPVSAFFQLKRLETHNHDVLRQSIEGFKPDLALIFGLSGLSKSIIYALRNLHVPSVYDVAGDWLSSELRQDPWLRWWNRKPAPVGGALMRGLFEWTGQRTRWDRLAPTRMMRGYDRLPDVYGTPDSLAGILPNSVAGFRFDRIYFCSRMLKAAAERAGFKVENGEVIYPGIDADRYVGEVRPPSTQATRFLFVSSLEPNSGAMTVLRALVKARESGLKGSLSIYGRGDSEHVAQLRSFAVLNQLSVEFLNVSNLVRDLPAVYRQHHALVYAAEWDEPFSLTPLEGMAAGLPLIAATSGGAAELFRDGETAWTYPPGDIGQLANRMLEVHTQPAVAHNIALAAQQMVMSQHNEIAVMDRIENYLQASLEYWQQV